MILMMNKLTVKAVAQLSGITEHTLRAWERRYQAIEPARTETGRRLYSLQDVERLKLLAALLEQGYSIGMIARLPDSELRSQLVRTSQFTTQSGVSLNPEVQISWIDPNSEIYAREIIRAVAEFKMDLMDQGLTRARSVLGVRTFVLEVISPVLAEVGRKGRLGEWTIAQEHAFSAILRDHLGQILRSFSTARDSEGDVQDPVRRVLFATPEGDLHEFGILISAILFASYNFKIFYLGPNMPEVALVQAAKQLGVGKVVIGTVSAGRLSNNYIIKLDQILPKDVQIWVGGPGFDLNGPQPKDHPCVYLSTFQELDRLLRAP